MDGGAWWARVHGVAKSRTRLSNFTFTLDTSGDSSGGSVVNNPPANAGDVGSILGLGRSSGEGNGNPLHYSCLGSPMDRRLAGYSPWGPKESVLSDPLQHYLFTIACQTPLSLGFSRQEYWSGLSFLSPGDLPNPGI